MKDNNILSWACSAITCLTGLALEDIFRIILLVIGIVSALVSLAYNIYCWWHKAKADGKIDAEEIKQLGDIIDNSKKSIEDITNKKED